MRVRGTDPAMQLREGCRCVTNVRSDTLAMLLHLLQRGLLTLSLLALLGLEELFLSSIVLLQSKKA